MFVKSLDEIFPDFNVKGPNEKLSYAKQLRHIAPVANVQQLKRQPSGNGLFCPLLRCRRSIQVIQFKSGNGLFCPLLRWLDSQEQRPIKTS